MDGWRKNQFGKLADHDKLYSEWKYFHPGNNFYCAMMIKAQIDHFEENMAALILEPDNQRLDVPRKLLPASAREGQHVLFLGFHLQKGAPCIIQVFSMM